MTILTQDYYQDGTTVTYHPNTPLVIHPKYDGDMFCGVNLHLKEALLGTFDTPTEAADEVRRIRRNPHEFYMITGTIDAQTELEDYWQSEEMGYASV